MHVPDPIPKTLVGVTDSTACSFSSVFAGDAGGAGGEKQAISIVLVVSPGLGIDEGGATIFSICGEGKRGRAVGGGL